MQYVYRLSDGVFTGDAFSIVPFDAARAAEHTPEGCAVFDGHVDVHSQRVNLETGELEEFVPAAPADNAWQEHEWNASAKRWLAKPTLQARAATMREQRGRLLAASDWTQMNDSPLSSETKAAWAAYRTALRQLPEQPGFPDNITWPDPPA